MARSCQAEIKPQPDNDDQPDNDKNQYRIRSYRNLTIIFHVRGKLTD